MAGFQECQMNDKATHRRVAVLHTDMKAGGNGGIC